MKTDCRYEQDVLDAINTGRWPDAVDAEVTQHVAGCEICRELVLVAEAFAAEHDSAPTPVPDASVVWLRAQVRASLDATRLAERPLSVAQAVGFAAAVGVLGAVLGASSSWLQRGIQWLDRALATLDPRSFAVSHDAVVLISEHAALAAMLGVAVVITPLLVYWGLKEN